MEFLQIDEALLVNVQLLKLLDHLGLIIKIPEGLKDRALKTQNKLILMMSTTAWFGLRAVLKPHSEDPRNKLA